MTVVRNEPGATARTSGERARFGRRLCALLVDGFLLFLVVTAGADYLQGKGVGIIALIAVAGAYSLIEGFADFSPGKLMLGLRIRNADGTKATRSKLLARWAVKNIGYICGTLAVATKTSWISYLGLLGALTIVLGELLALRPHCQTLHDKFLLTAVFRVSSSTRLQGEDLKFEGVALVVLAVVLFLVGVLTSFGVVYFFVEHFLPPASKPTSDDWHALTAAATMAVIFVWLGMRALNAGRRRLANAAKMRRG
jgi:uncharacterized RDD family membrane protein YckC